MENCTNYISIIFGLIAFLVVFTFFTATRCSKGFLLIIMFWISFQTIISLSGFYKNSENNPILFCLMFLPPALLFIRTFFSGNKTAIDQFDMHLLLVIHIVRAPVELVLYWFFICRSVDCTMVFDSGKLDMFFGMTAPVIYYYAVMRGRIKWRFLVVWNILGLGVLLNVVIKSILATPILFQKIASEQFDNAILHFPFIFLPGLIIPIILFSHLAVMRNLVKVHSNESESEQVESQLLGTNFMETRRKTLTRV